MSSDAATGQPKDPKASGYILPHEQQIARMNRIKERRLLTNDDPSSRVTVGLDVDDVNFMNSQVELQDATAHQQRMEVRQVMADAAKAVVTDKDKNFLDFQQKHMREKARQKREAEETKKAKSLKVVKLIPVARKRREDSESSSRSRSRSRSRSDEDSDKEGHKAEASPRGRKRERGADSGEEGGAVEGSLGSLLNY